MDYAQVKRDTERMLQTAVPQAPPSVVDAFAHMTARVFTPFSYEREGRSPSSVAVRKTHAPPKKERRFTLQRFDSLDGKIVWDSTDDHDCTTTTTTTTNDDGVFSGASFADMQFRSSYARNTE